jgi:hypothetical protein
MGKRLMVSTCRPKSPVTSGANSMSAAAIRMAIVERWKLGGNLKAALIPAGTPG